MMLSEYLLIGQVLRPQGVKGEVKVRPDTDDPGRFMDLDYAYIQPTPGQYQKVSVSGAWVREQFAYLRLQNAQSREEAEAQRDWLLYIDREHAAKLAPDEDFICDLIGCTVETLDGEKLGEVTDVLQRTANDVYVINTDRGEMLLPALKFVVPTVDVKARKIVVDAARLQEVAVYQDE